MRTMLACAPALLASAAIACSSSTASPPPLGLADERIATSGTFRLQPSEPCTFALVEGASAGAIDDGGFYRAPASPGVFHVRATSRADATREQTIAISVEAAQLRLVAGALGASGSWDGVGELAGFDRPSSIASDGGRLVVGEDGHLRVVDVATRTVTTVASFEGSPTSLAIDDGDAYFALGTAIWKLPKGATGAQRFAGADESFGTADGDLATARFSNLLYLAVGEGHVLWVADSDNQTLRRVDLVAGQVTTVAGDPKTVESIDGIGKAAGFVQTEAIAWDPRGVLWLVDEGGYALRRFDPATAEVKTAIAGTDGAPFHPIVRGLVADGAGHLFTTDPVSTLRIDTDTFATHVLAAGGSGISFSGGSLYVLGDQVVAMDPTTGATTAIAGSPETIGYTDAVGADARFYDPTDLFAWDGGLLVGDEFNHALRRVDPASGAVTTASTTSCPVSLVDDRRGGAWISDPCATSAIWQRLDLATMTATPAPAFDLFDLVHVGPDRTIFATQLVAGGHRRVFTTDEQGRRTAIAGGFGLVALAGDGAGHLFVADAASATLHRVTIATKLDEVFAGAPFAFDHVDGPRGASRLRGPTNLVADRRGGLFFVDGDTIRKMDAASGEIATVVGQDAHPTLRVGPLPANVFRARGLAIDRSGRLWFLEPNAVMTVDVPL